MDFAPEPVRDAFPLPQSRPAQANTAPRDDGGRSFDDYLEAANEPQPENTAPPQNETRDEPAAPVETRALRSDDANPSDEDVDADAALLGGPAPPAPPPMSAPVVIQIAASQAAPTPQTQAPPEGDEAAIAPSPGSSEPAMPEMAAAAQPAAANETVSSKSNAADAKDAAAKTSQGDGTSQDQAQESDSALIAARQASAPAPSPELPDFAQQAIAATIAPAPPATAPPRSAKNATQAIDANTAPDAREAKVEAAASHAKTQTTNAAKAAGNGKTAVDAAPAPSTQSAAPDASQIAENSAISTTATQASTHVQQASAETGAQRAAPAGAQVGREIIRRFNGGTTNFELRLDPADLGRVEVRMEVTRDHRVTAVISADNPQALTELARGARELEQQLQSAGLQLSENGLSFDLRQGAQGGGDANDANKGARGNSEVAPIEQQAALVARPIGYERWRGVRVDMMV